MVVAWMDCTYGTNVEAMSSCSQTATASDGNRASCHHKAELPTMSPHTSTSASCECDRSNLLQINNRAKGLHVEIHRGVFRSQNLVANSNPNPNNINININWHQQLLTNVRWHRVKYKSNRFQKDCETPCYTAFYGGRNEYHPYAPVPSWFQPLIDQVTCHLGNSDNSGTNGTNNGGAVRPPVLFNAFLLRLYFDGNDEIAWHTDGRTFLGDQPTIASLSLGCKATFQLRRMNNVWPSCATTNTNNGSSNSKSNSTDAGGGGTGCSGADRNTPIESFMLNDGDLLVMRGDTQKHWHHRVPKEKGRGVRLNINFRYIMPGLDAERGQRTYYKYMVYGDCPMDNNGDRGGKGEEPPSWTFDEIMKKRGGMMSFLRRGIDRKGERKGDVVQVDETVNQSAETHGGTMRLEEISAQKSSDSSIHESPSNTEQSTINHDSNTQNYLASQQSNVDPKVFMALPKEIQKELVHEFRPSNEQSTTNHDSNTQNYLASQQSSVDPKVFMALPKEIQKELVHESPSNNEQSTTNQGSNTQNFFASQQSSSVDPKVFMALPKEIQKELVSQWNSRQKPPPTATNTTSLPAQNNVTGKRKSRNGSIPSTAVAGKKTKSNNCRKGAGKSTTNHDSYTQNYMASQQSSIDPEVFMDLPKEIQKELVSQWNNSHQKLPSTATTPNPTTSLPAQNNATGKKKSRSENILSTAVVGKKTKSNKCGKGTLDSYFGKKE